MDNDLPTVGSTTLPVTLYPASAEFLRPFLEAAASGAEMAHLEGKLKKYAVIDICNFRNQLLAHLQRVPLGQ